MSDMEELKRLWLNWRKGRQAATSHLLRYLLTHDPDEVLKPVLWWDVEHPDEPATDDLRNLFDGYPIGEIGEAKGAVGDLHMFGAWLDDETFLTAPTREELEARLKEAGDG